MANNAKRFGDLGFNFADVKAWHKIDELIDKEIMVVDCIEVRGNFGNYLIVKYQDMMDSSINAFTTGSKVICEKILTAKDKKLLPLPGQIVKKKNWYDII